MKAVHSDDIQTVQECLKPLYGKIFAYHVNALKVALSNNRWAISSLLLEHGVPTKDLDDGCLARSAGEGQTKVVLNLIESGVDINSQTLYGQTALIAASKNGHVDTVKTLIQKGCRLDTRYYSDGETALFFAVRHGHSDVAEHVLNAGADANAKNKQSQTPLLVAIKKNNDSMIRLLAKHGANTDHFDCSLENQNIDPSLSATTYLMYAAATGLLKSVTALLEIGVDPCAKNHHGNDALDLANLYNQKETAALIESFIEQDRLNRSIVENQACKSLEF